MDILDAHTNDPQSFAIRGALCVDAQPDAVGPTDHLKVKLNGAEFYRADVPPKNKRQDGTVMHFDYEHGPITASGRGRIDVEMAFGDGGPTATDQSYVLGR